ncbi:hypothetical protein Anapl_10322 [Anas platyrhynchos]|uniref:Uncharacterized protein n=1 Tax=Anas platyrhynchos TaxID=8839 RepID=R0LCT0_ANAPL|nr:hypothetical protein Anapl_10322 [Anas platyrhynchos]
MDIFHQILKVPKNKSSIAVHIAICRGDRLRGRRVLQRSRGSGQAGLTFRHRADFREPPGPSRPRPIQALKEARRISLIFMGVILEQRLA